MEGVTHIIVDEVHERSVDCDLLLGLLKEIRRFRPELKMILMSASLSTSLFADYFDNSPTLNIPGKVFPVEEKYYDDVLKVAEPYLNKVLQKYYY